MLPLIIGITGAVLIGAILYARWNYGFLEKLGIKVVAKPFFVMGNTLEFCHKPGGYFDIECMKKFGTVYGLYEGREPQIHICDAELIRLVTTKDAEYFNDKRRIDFRDPFLNEMPDFQPYDKWKTIRSFLTPTFSSAKLKLMGEPMLRSLENFCNDLKDNIKSQPGHKLEKYDLRDAYFTMITDLIARAAFNVKVDNPSDPNNAFVQIVRDFMVPGETQYFWIEQMSYSFPILRKFLPGIMNAKNAIRFKEIFLQMMESRKRSGIKLKDVVDLCLEQMEKVNTPEYKKMGITKETIICQAFVFFFAGQDQISTVSSYMIYGILNNPEIEERLYRELDEFLEENNGQITYDNVSKLTYLNACLTESLRLVPFFSRTERVCTKDWTNKEYGLAIPKGTVIQIPIWAANRNPEHFPDPEKYDPERFLSPRKEALHPYAMTSFGHGPRNCIGQKFSMDTMMLTSASVLKHFKFHLRSDSKPVFAASGPFFTGHLPFYFDATLRN